MKQTPQKAIIDLEKLNTLNAEGCPACGKKFSLGETAVLACGDWGDTPKWVHEKEAIFDRRTAAYVERSCYQAAKKV